MHSRLRAKSYPAISCENPTQHKIAQHGADARSGPLPGTEDPIPARLLGKRKGPLNAQTGRQANGLSR